MFLIDLEHTTHISTYRRSYNETFNRLCTPPNPQSFNHTILEALQGRLQEKGHEVRVLYERFFCGY